MSEQILSDLYAEAPEQEASGARITPFGIVVIFASIFMIGVVAWGIYQNNQSQPEGGEAPDFTLPLIMDEGEFTLSEQQGNVVVVNFWGSWCGPCRDEAPMLQDNFERFQDRGVVFVGIAVKDTPRDATEYIEEFGITYPNVMDLGGHMEDAYRTQGVPETFIIGRDGEITKFFFATPNELEFVEAIEDALDA